MKLTGIVETESGFDIVQRKDLVDRYHAALKAARLAERHFELATDDLDKFKSHALTSWNGTKNWTRPVSHQAKFGWSYWAMPADTPNGDQLWKTIEHYGKRVHRAYKDISKYQRLASKLKKLYRSETFDKLKNGTPKATIPSAEVPRRIYYTKDNYFNNPYWDRENITKRYAGPVGHFPNFTNAERNTLTELERTLRHYGIPGLETLYGVTVKVRRQEINRFVVVGAGGRFIWKRIGGNVCYVDGKRVSISYMTNASVTNATHDEVLHMQKQLLEPLARKENENP